jgi:hypothetical protein
MTAKQTADGPDATGREIPAEDEEVDMLYLARQRPQEEGAWLWVTTVDARHGGEFTALSLPSTRPRASGGDVLLHIAPGRGEGGACCGSCKSTALMSGHVSRSRWRRQRSRLRPGSPACRPG